MNGFKTGHNLNEVHKSVGVVTAGWKVRINRLKRFLGTHKTKEKLSLQ
jgi:hypothetical protein